MNPRNPFRSYYSYSFPEPKPLPGTRLPKTGKHKNQRRRK